jgi:ribonuclease T1
MKKQLTAWLLALVMLFSLVGCGTDAPVQDETNLPQQEQQDVQNAPSEDADMPDETAQIDEDGSYTTKDDVALYIHTYGHLPDNFITKKDAQALGWPGGSLEPYAPGKCIGGSRFGNYEGLLPEADGRTYTECDIDTLGADSRGAKRIVFSNDGLIYYTEDHYETFELLYGEE